MKQLSNKELILILIEGCDIEDKCDILTSIGLGTKCEKLFNITEEIRSEICSQEDEEKLRALGISTKPKRRNFGAVLLQAGDGENASTELV